MVTMEFVLIFCGRRDCKELPATRLSWADAGVCVGLHYYRVILDYLRISYYKMRKLGCSFAAPTPVKPLHRTQNMTRLELIRPRAYHTHPCTSVHAALLQIDVASAS